MPLFNIKSIQLIFNNQSCILNSINVNNLMLYSIQLLPKNVKKIINEYYKIENSINNQGLSKWSLL